MEEKNTTKNENSFGVEKSQEFSHNVLVMTALARASQCLSKEMIAGYWNEREDRMGNIIKSYIPDSRLEFIGAVKSAEAMMICDLKKEEVKEISSNINSIKERLNGLKEKYIDLQAKDWVRTPKIEQDLKISEGLRFRVKLLNPKLPFLNEYILEQVEIYEEILRELILLSEKLNFYKPKPQL